MSKSTKNDVFIPEKFGSWRDTELHSIIHKADNYLGEYSEKMLGGILREICEDIGQPLVSEIYHCQLMPCHRSHMLLFMMHIAPHEADEGSRGNKIIFREFPHSDTLSAKDDEKYFNCVQEYCHRIICRTFKIEAQLELGKWSSRLYWPSESLPTWSGFEEEHEVKAVVSKIKEYLDEHAEKATQSDVRDRIGMKCFYRSHSRIEFHLMRFAAHNSFDWLECGVSGVEMITFYIIRPMNQTPEDLESFIRKVYLEFDFCIWDYTNRSTVPLFKGPLVCKD